MKYSCEKCEKSYPTYDSLHRHVKEKHRQELEPPRKLHCPEPRCMKTFDTPPKLLRHKRDEHNMVKIPKPLMQCVFCEYYNFCEDKLTGHLYEKHKLNVFKIEKTFEGKDNLKKWIEKEEEDSLCKFNKQEGHTSYQKLVCNRNFTSVLVKKQSPMEGSKLYAFCPAHIKYTEEGGTISVEYINIHTHGVELRQLNLTSDIKLDLPRKIDEGVPFDAILDKVRDSIYKGDEIDRQNRLTKRHLDNIQISYNLNDPNENAVFAWMQDEVERGDKSCILFHKLQGQTSAGLASDDCMFAVMNCTQASILEKFSMDTICLEAFSSHGCFHLVALMVLDDIRQAIPCAFLITNRLDQVSLQLFFRKIRDRVGDICCKYFMSHMDPSLYRAFISVMPEPKKRIYSTWHVDRDWRDNLKLIESKENQCEMYKLLRRMMQEPCTKNFSRLFGDMEQFVKNQNTEQFTCYFLKNYGKVETWTFCHRECDVVSDMHLDRMHKIINKAFGQGEMLDKMLYILQRFFRDQLYNGARITAKPYMLKQRHDVSLSMDPQSIMQQENGWVCPSSNSYVFYYIEQNDCQCHMACERCHGCIHSFKCTCPDNTVKWNMCKHIHLLCRKSDSKVEENKQANIEGHSGLVLGEPIVRKEEESRKDDLEEIKKNLLENFTKLLQNASREDLKRYEKMVKRMRLDIDVDGLRKTKTKNAEAKHT